jgi:hypothetical protein
MRRQTHDARCEQVRDRTICSQGPLTGTPPPTDPKELTPSSSGRQPLQCRRHELYLAAVNWGDGYKYKYHFPKISHRDDGKYTNTMSFDSAFALGGLWGIRPLFCAAWRFKPVTTLALSEFSLCHHGVLPGCGPDHGKQHGKIGGVAWSRAARGCSTLTLGLTAS